MIKTSLGIDISKEKFDVALLLNDKFKTKAFNNTSKGFENLYGWAQKHVHNLDNIHICMEATGIYGDKLATFLFEKALCVSVVNPARVKGFGQSELSRNKSDKADAKLIARFCKAMNPEPWKPVEKHLQELRGWVKRLDSLKAIKQQETNRLESATEKVSEDILEHIQYLDEAIQKSNLVITEIIEGNDDLKKKRDLIETIPGIGKTTQAVVLAFIGNPEDFTSAKQVAAFLGLNPKQHQSGSSVNGRTKMSKTGDSYIRKSLFMPAIVARHHNPIIKLFCDNLANSGKSKMAIIGAAMRKLVHIIYGVLKNECPFDPKWAL